jgi:protein-disulfide isomerase
MVEFTDLECPFCRQFQVTTFERIKKEYIDSGKVRYVVRDLPLTSLHPTAAVAAVAAHCAGRWGKFWDMRYAILAGAGSDQPGLLSVATGLRLDLPAFRRCTASTNLDAELRRNRADADRVGIEGTPSFVIGRTNGDAVEGTLIEGARSFETFEAALKGYLGGGSM